MVYSIRFCYQYLIMVYSIIFCYQNLIMKLVIWYSFHYQIMTFKKMIIDQSYLNVLKSDFVYQNLIWAQIKFRSNIEHLWDLRNEWELGAPLVGYWGIWVLTDVHRWRTMQDANHFLFLCDWLAAFRTGIITTYNMILVLYPLVLVVARLTRRFLSALSTALPSTSSRRNSTWPLADGAVTKWKIL
jgi:hypothetical protein